MTTTKVGERREFIERELKKWEEEFIIPFDQKFEVEAILDLQYQYSITEDGHVKTKSDILFTISRAKRDLGLKTKVKTEPNNGRGLTISDSNGGKLVTLGNGELFINGKIEHSKDSFRDVMIGCIKEINTKALLNKRLDDVVTRLYYKFEDVVDFVEDFTPFIAGKYMSDELMKAISNHTTLTFDQKCELVPYIKEKNYNY